MSKTNKAEFNNLLSKLSEKKELEVPLQKVVPAEISFSTAERKINTSFFKISLSLYVADWMDLTRFKNHQILERKNLEYTISDTINYGLSLLEKKYKIIRNRDKISLKKGRRNKERIPVKTSSVDLPSERVDFINDFLYFKVFDNEELEYTRPEMFAEMVTLIKKNNKNIFEE